MLPPDGPFLEPALALLALPFRPVAAGLLPAPLLLSWDVSKYAMPGTHQQPPVKLVV